MTVSSPLDDLLAEQLRTVVDDLAHDGLVAWVDEDALRITDAGHQRIKGTLTLPVWVEFVPSHEHPEGLSIKSSQGRTIMHVKDDCEHTSPSHARRKETTAFASPSSPS